MPERPPSLDEQGHKKTIIPAEVTGRFRRHRDWSQGLLIVIFLVLPWIHISGEQIFLLDVVHRQFTLFGLKLYAYDAPLLFYMVAIIVFGIVFFTVVWGRVFCGWACPQTVFIDGVFRRIERWTEGNYLKRRQLQNKKLTPEDVLRKLLKWALFLFATSVITHSFIALFVGSQHLVNMISGGPRENWPYFVLISVITALLLFDFVWFREQFCLIMCPYGRLQSVLTDSRSLAITYNVARGEPRKGTAHPGEKLGDCVSCRRCVEVCPTGIDIRHGLQLECIACTACIDACDEIMEKVKKPKGLIRYADSRGNGWSLRSPRAIWSLFIIVVVSVVLIYSLSTRSFADVSVLRGKGPLYQVISSSEQETIYSNHFRLHIKNQKSAPLTLNLKAYSQNQPLDLATPQNPLELKPYEDKAVVLFLKFPHSFLNNGKATAEIYLESPHQDLKLERTIQLLGPQL